MSGRVKDFFLATSSLDRAKPIPLSLQLYEEVRNAIISGRFRAGTRLPSTRVLASDLRISRNTVVSAFEQLASEGYVKGNVGSGTRVTDALPDEFLWVRTQRNGKQETRKPARPPSRRAENVLDLAKFYPVVKPVPFRHGLPALDEFPRKLWAEITTRRWRQLPSKALGYGASAGFEPLRRAIASYLAVSRSVQCQPEQVVMVTGSQQALYLATQLLIDPDDPAWIEDPGYLGARSTLLAAGARLIPVPVDSEGINVSQGLRANPKPKLIYVSPSNQYPLTITMSLARRIELLECAHRSGAWIIEDDYDSEFRYHSRPVAALKGLGHSSQIIYIGTFSKLLIPALRLGFVVAPPSLVDAFNALSALISRHPPYIEQVVLADFINEGHLGRHIRRMRSLYFERQNYFCDMAMRKLGDLIELKQAEAGTHLIGWLPRGAEDQAIARKAAEAGVETKPLSSYYLDPPNRGGLVLGYAAFNKAETDTGMQKLASVLRAILRPSGARS